ncbi:putative phd finger containing protein phf1 protein [Rosellinia necatrix]|uniref:Putative phd finger containing protein phf1 protein n=1 Tax=Rosellinia necatrix TaxID=77044 RepID=A0A1S7UHU7_ROSNE|nr:putative phd finger containing protein phf1 protein [Rosellinia necatrix]
MEDNSKTPKTGLGGDVVTAETCPSPGDQRPVPAASPAPSSTSSMGQRPYVPQFSAATQMILSRISSKPGSLSAALSSASSMARSIEKSAFDDAKRRLVMNMNTSLTMPMPTPRQGQPSSMPDSFQLRTSAPMPTVGTAKPAPTKVPVPKPSPSKSKGKAPRGTKRKRGKENEGASSSQGELSDSDVDAVAKAQAAATMTKSGRQVQKPAQFNPVESVTPQKRKHYGKRTADQALCKVCTRGLSPNMNQIVFCDGCNFCWHQMCHDPYIDDDVVRDENRSWFCSRCMSKREKALAKKKTMTDHKGVSWASKSAAQKRTYLTNIPHSQLVNIIMYSTELHPDLPIFPAQESGASTKRGGQGGSTGSAAGPFSRVDSRLSGPVNFNSTVSTPDARGSDTGGKPRTKRKGSTETQGQGERESSVESILPAWPKVGQGVLAGLEMSEDDLRDKNDFEAFSVTTYDGNGRKVMENGMPV